MIVAASSIVPEGWSPANTGRVRSVSPTPPAASAGAIRPWLTAQMSDEVFPSIARGDVLLCQGITEPGSVITRSVCEVR